MATDNSNATAPIWLRVGGILSLGTAVVIFFGDPNAISGGYLAVMALISVAAALGSRIGWGLLLLIAATVEVEFVFSGQTVFVAALWGGIAISLVNTSSVRFVWRQQRQPLISTIPGVGRPLSKIRRAMYSAIVWFAQAEAGQLEKGTFHRKAFSVLLWRLGYCCAGLFLVYVVAFNVQSGDQGGGTGIVDVIAAASRVGFVICLLLFLAVGFAAALTRLRGSPNSSNSG